MKRPRAEFGFEGDVLVRLVRSSAFGASAVTTASVFSTSMETISCFLPSSRIVKSSALRSLTSISSLSFTTTLTRTISVEVFSVNWPSFAAGCTCDAILNGSRPARITTDAQRHRESLFVFSGVFLCASVPVRFTPTSPLTPTSERRTCRPHHRRHSPGRYKNQV